MLCAAASAEVRSNAADIDAYVAAHPAAFGTTYLTRTIRDTWAQEAGYSADLDLALYDGDALVAFAVSYLCGGTAEIGTVGVIPSARDRGFAQAMVDEALCRLVQRGAVEATMSTSSLNAPMLAVARSRGFAVVRRTFWWRTAIERG